MSTFRPTFIDSANKILIDEPDATTTYVGNADLGTPTSSPTWTIRRLTTTGDNLAVEYADGNASFNKTWDNRATYTYS